LETVETEVADSDVDSDAENEVDDNEMDQMDDETTELDDEALFEEDEEKPKDKKKGKKGALKDDISKHKEELELLREQDPEFYEFLKKEESGLLDFDVSDEDLEDESEAEDEVMKDGHDEEEQEKEESKFSDEEYAVGLDEPMTGAMSHTDAQVVTKEMIEEWASALETRKSVKTLKHLLSAFKCAARMNDEDDENTSYTYKVTSGTGMCSINILSGYEIMMVLTYDAQFSTSSFLQHFDLFLSVSTTTLHLTRKVHHRSPLKSGIFLRAWSSHTAQMCFTCFED
jgi:hypothetical protein